MATRIRAKEASGGSACHDPKGLRKLSREADKQLESKSTTIAEKLGKVANTGNLAYVKVLVDLALRKKPGSGGRKKCENTAVAIIRDINRGRLRPESEADAIPNGAIETEGEMGNRPRS